LEGRGQPESNQASKAPRLLTHLPTNPPFCTPNPLPFFLPASTLAFPRHHYHPSIHPSIHFLHSSFLPPCSYTVTLLFTLPLPHPEDPQSEGFLRYLAESIANHQLSHATRGRLRRPSEVAWPTVGYYTQVATSHHHQVTPRPNHQSSKYPNLSILPSSFFLHPSFSPCQ